MTTRELLLWVSVALLYCFVYWFVFHYSPPAPLPARIQPTPAEKVWYAEQRRIHGNVTFIHEAGEIYFIRNGQRCRL